MKLFTWLDVRRLIRQKTFYGSQLPEGITSINCFSDALEISLSNVSDQSLAESILQGWFGEWYQNEHQIIQLDLGDSVLSVEFSAEELDTDTPINVRPFWQEIAYISDNSAESVSTSNNLKLPRSYTIPPSLIAFYSFKGGVGRTLHLAAHLFALLDYAKEIDKPITVLVIDADLEAPGLTYWDRSEKQQPAVSFINFLEAYHYSPLPIKQTLELFVKEIRKTPKNEGKSTFYFLPACLKDEQLLDTPVLPEHLARSPGDGWTFGDAIHELGKALKVDYVLVDLRAGLSEISSPLIFDPRIQRFFVTTATEQSVAGSSLVLEQISRVAPSEEDVDNSKYFDPSIIVSFLTPELKALPAFYNALVKFRTAYVPATSSEDANIYSKRLEIKETDFSQELLYVNNWNEARLKIAPTSISKVAREWAVSQLKDSIDLTKLEPGSIDSSKSLEEVRKFRDICRQYEFAESGAGEKILVTKALQNLANNFQNELPRVVSIGAKGSGKTFIYVQLSRLRSWENFLQVALGEKSELNAHIFPFLQSKNLQDNAKSIVSRAREKVKAILGESTPEFFHSDYEERIQQALTQESTELQWTGFWINEISRSLGLISGEKSSVSIQEINNHLKSKSIHIVYLIFPINCLRFAKQIWD
jgi:cellulose biosynthesis protein BcsQ